MVGYSYISKGYRILDPQTDQIFISITVKFNEFLNDPFRDNKCKVQINNASNESYVIVNITDVELNENKKVLKTKIL